MRTRILAALIAAVLAAHGLYRCARREDPAWTVVGVYPDGTSLMQDGTIRESSAYFRAMWVKDFADFPERP